MLISLIQLSRSAPVGETESIFHLVTRKSGIFSFAKASFSTQGLHVTNFQQACPGAWDTFSDYVQVVGSRVWCVAMLV